MATSEEYIRYVCEQIRDTGALRYKKMFGEYMVYVNDKPILLVCDSVVYVKKLACIQVIMQDADCGIPYSGSKEYYILDIEDSALCREVVMHLEQATPLPKPKPPKKKKTT